REALMENTRARVPLVWGFTQSNLGAALSRLGDQEGSSARLEESIAVLREALEEITRARVPLIWANTQQILGNVLLSLGTRESSSARLEQAIAALREALEEITRRLSRSAEGTHPRTRPARLGLDTTQSRLCALHAR